MVRTTFVALTCGMLGAASALEVVTPSADQVVIADRTYTVEWTGTGSGSHVGIDLYYCGSYCTEDDCGDWTTSLCPYGDTGCPDSTGDYDVVMPEPMMGTSGSGYKVMVTDMSDETESDCSDEFFLMAAGEAPTTGDTDGPFLTVTAPADGDVAIVGEEYTVEWDYDNGVGSKVDRFSIDLYMADGSGDCGTYYATVCDKPSIGCKDSQGDYDVMIPTNAPSGMYKLRVGRFEDESLFDCSDTFEVVGDEITSMSFRF